MSKPLVKDLSLKRCQQCLAPRALDAHKGDFGHVLVIGGDYGMGGACRLAGEVALRAGAGLVSIATRPQHAFAIMGVCPELMCHGIEKKQDLKPLLKRATVIAVGPGLGQNSWGKMLFSEVLKSDLPLVVDADALNQLALKPKMRKNWILTPHPGEAARLLKTSQTEIQKNRLKAIVQLQKRYQGVIVLKGAGSLVLGPTKTIQFCNIKNPALAAPGMGDVLTGVIAALVAQGLSLEEAGSLGVMAHATAGNKISAGYERGILARDLLKGIQECLNP